MVVLIPLTFSLLVSTLRLSLLFMPIKEPFEMGTGSISGTDPPEVEVFKLLSQNRNLTFFRRGPDLFADSMNIVRLSIGSANQLELKCVNDVSLRITFISTTRFVPSPSLCSRSSDNKLLIGAIGGEDPSICISNVTLGNDQLLDNWCSDDSGSTMLLDTPDLSSLYEPFHLNEFIEVAEGLSVPLRWKNLHISQLSKSRISNEEISFKIIGIPQHGNLLISGEKASEFKYDDLRSDNVIYKHDGTETTEDAFDLQISLRSGSSSKGKTIIYTIPIRIQPVNDAPEIRAGSAGAVIRMPVKARAQLNDHIMNLWDADNDPDTIKITMVSAEDARLEYIDGKEIISFTQREFLNNQIYIAHNGKAERGDIHLQADDGNQKSTILTISVITVPIEIHLKTNTGLKVLHRSFGIISAANLSFMASLPDLPLQYSIVDLPEYGSVECLDNHGQYQICSTFMQNKIENGQIRYKHSSHTNPPSDSFSFQVRAGNISSIVHVFKITFIPVHVKIFNRVTFLLNNTDSLNLKREHLFAWTFPKTFPPQQVIFHIIEPPKFGVLSRRIDGKKNRRIGVSSNFTQEHINNGVLSYKLHYIQYSVINDFLIFRVVTPSVTSESTRLEITYIPGLGAMQLINRTIIVDEGGMQKITNESLSLETPDDNNFIFTIGVAPAFGNILLTQTSGERFTLSVTNNFTTQDINNGGISYEHRGGETREDRFYLVAESIYRRASRIPFWMTVKTILKNDNPPESRGKIKIHIIDRGDRLLYPSLLPWRDEDIDSQPLRFIFHDGFRNAALLSQTSPGTHIRNFTQQNLQNHEILLRHLGHSKNFEMTYTVSDGLHDVLSTINVVVSEPFVRLEEYEITIPSEISVPTILITNENLSASTNLDVDINKIIFTVYSSNWITEINSSQHTIKNFSQQDINDAKIQYRVSKYPEVEEIMVSVGNLSTKSAIKRIEKKRSNSPSLELRILSVLTIPISSISQIDNDVLLSVAPEKNPSEIIYDVIIQPKSGTLILESVKISQDGHAIMPSNFFVNRFTQAHINAGQLQYLHNGMEQSRDAFAFNISISNQTIGPYTLFINIVDEQAKFAITNISLPQGGNTPLKADLVRKALSQNEGLTIKIMKKPASGWIVKDTWNLANITSLDQFTITELDSRQIYYVNNPKTGAEQDFFTVSACSTTQRCSDAKDVYVHLQRRNIHEPELVRNEVMKIWNSNTAPITKQYLFAEDDDTPPENIIFIINEPLNGYLVRNGSPNKQIFNFSQSEINRSEIFFVKYKNTTSAGGFSFLITDGLHQVGPEWFTVESSQVVSVALEGNSRLIIPPGDTPSVIGMDLLRARIPNATPGQIIYSISKAPKLGNLLRLGRAVTSFTQEDINSRRITYQQRSNTADSWLKKDWFQFIISCNGSAKPIVEEYRFRISITYAVLPTNRLREYIPMRKVFVGRGGSVAINSSHIDLNHLISITRTELMVEFSQAPVYGTLEFTTGERYFKATELSTGRRVIYRQNELDSRLDNIPIHIYPRNDVNKRANHLRISIPVIINSIVDTNLKIVSLPERIKVVSGDEVLLDPESFQITHPYVQPSAIVYRLLQAGSNGIEIRIGNERIRDFSQGDLNKRKIKICHRQRFDTEDNIDVLVMQIGERTHALIILIKPLSLAVHNHTDLSYMQGKTYVILNRSNLGANSNGDRSKIVYNITRPPENGTLYWVAGENEVKSFTQKDIDDEKVLYAQINMLAYKDFFEFTVSNENNDVVSGKLRVAITAAIKTEKLTVRSKKSERIKVENLDASTLEGKTPRFLVIDAPRYGHFILNNLINESIIFFTFVDIINGRVSYTAYETDIDLIDNVEFQLEADNVQPARFKFAVNIIPIYDYHTVPPVSRAPITTTEQPLEYHWFTSYHLPILILLIILLLMVLILMCKRYSMDRKKNKFKENQLKKELEVKLDSAIVGQPDLLDSTIYATVKRSRIESNGQQQPLKSAQTFEPSLCRVTPLSFSSSPLVQRSEQKVYSGSLDYSALNRGSLETPRTRSDKYQTTKLKESQYWV